MKRRRNKGVSQAVHGQQRRIARRIPVVIDKGRPRQGGAGSRFNRIDFNVLSVDFIQDKRKRKPGKIAAAAGAADDHIRIFTDFFHLFFGLKTDDGLMQHDMVQNASKGIPGFAARVADRSLDGFADGNSQASRRVGIFLQSIPAGLGFHAGAGHTFPPPGFHHGFTIRLLVKADPDYIHLAFQSELTAGKGQRTSPLPGAGFSGQSFDAEDFIVIGLGNGGVGFVASRRTDAFVFKIDPRRGIQGFFQREGPDQGGRPPDAVNIQDRFRNVNPPVRTDLLFNQVHGKYRRQIFRPNGVSIRTQRGIHFDVRKDVVPLTRHFILG